jgi:hypothetical protein
LNLHPPTYLTTLGKQSSFSAKIWQEKVNLLVEKASMVSGGGSRLSVAHTRSMLAHKCIDILQNWVDHANQAWTWLSPAEVAASGRDCRNPDVRSYTQPQTVAGYYGTGYSSWGVMAQAAATGVFGILAKATDNPDLLERFQKGLRYLLGTHAAGPLRLTDGNKWGASISAHDKQYAALWLTQGLLAYDLLADKMAPYDHALIRSVVVAEADQYLAAPIEGGLSPGANRAEANALKASVLARAALLYPKQQHATQWQQKATAFWLNSISVEQDARNERIVAGRPIKHWHLKPNFHTHYGVTHHGFFHPSDIALTLGIMAVAGLMYKQRHRVTPIETFHHWGDAMHLLSQLYLWDQTFACVGGQSWPRYTWDQSMILPALAWDSSHKTDALASSTPLLSSQQTVSMVAGLLSYLQYEQEQNGDGSFYGKRLTQLKENTEWEYFRYEAGTAFSVAAAYAILTLNSDTPYHTQQRATEESMPSFPVQAWPENSISYREPSLGTLWCRGHKRFASWCWQACQIPAQGLIIPRSGKRLTEWNGNMVGTVRLKEHEPYHALQYHREAEFPTGFCAMGLIAEQLPMWPMADKTPSLRHGLAFFVLPDDATCILIDLLWCERQVNLVQNTGLLYKVANDITNGNSRLLTYQGGSRRIHGVGATSETWRPDSPWLVVDDCLFIMPIWGGELAVNIQGERISTLSAGGDHSLLWHEICAPYDLQYQRMRTGEVLRDTCTAFVCEAPGVAGAATAESLAAQPLTVNGVDTLVSPYARAVQVTDNRGCVYTLAVNFDRNPTTVRLSTDIEPTFIAGNGQVRNEELLLPPASFIICRNN